MAGADRVRFKHRDHDAFSEQAYVAVAPFECNPLLTCQRT